MTTADISVIDWTYQCCIFLLLPDLGHKIVSVSKKGKKEFKNKMFLLCFCCNYDLQSATPTQTPSSRPSLQIHCCHTDDISGSFPLTATAFWSTAVKYHGCTIFVFVSLLFFSKKNVSKAIAPLRPLRGIIRTCDFRLTVRMRKTWCEAETPPAGTKLRTSHHRSHEPGGNSVERRSAGRCLLKGQKQAIVSQRGTRTVSKATLEAFLRDWLAQSPYRL